MGVNPGDTSHDLTNGRFQPFWVGCLTLCFGSAGRIEAGRRRSCGAASGRRPCFGTCRAKPPPHHRPRPPADDNHSDCSPSRPRPSTRSPPVERRDDDEWRTSRHRRAREVDELQVGWSVASIIHRRPTQHSVDPPCSRRWRASTIWSRLSFPTSIGREVVHSRGDRFSSNQCRGGERQFGR